MISVNTIVTVVETATMVEKLGREKLRVVSPAKRDGYYDSRFMDILVSDKAPEWVQKALRTASKGDRLFVQGSLQYKEGNNGRGYDSLEFINNVINLSGDVNDREANREASREGRNTTRAGRAVNPLDDL